MFQAGQLQLMVFFLWGFTVLFGQAMIMGTLGVWFLQFIAIAFGETYAWGPVLQHLILSIYFLMLFPGQHIWTLELQGPGERTYVIVGRATNDSEA